MVDNKQYAGQVLIYVGLAYFVLVAARMKSRFRASWHEVVVVVIMLLILSVLLPVVFGSVGPEP